MNSPPLSASHVVAGLRLDRYELLCPIAEGGMASVWIARLQGKRGFEKLFAVKTILAKHATDVRFEQMFLDESRIASAIEHVNVAQILELGEEHGVLYLVMEYVDGDSLSKLHRSLEKKELPFPQPILLRILADACAGLHAAHELRDAEGQLRNIVHRDVSPQNILVNSKGVAKIVDFGIAKARDRLSGETNTGAMKGKIQYMAPEQATGGAVDRRADIWAVGAVLYHLLAGHPPFDADNQMITLHMLTARQPPPPLPRTVPLVISTVVARALAFDPADRYATALEMQLALENALRQIGAAPTTDEVGAFVREHLSDRLDERKRAIQQATSSAGFRSTSDPRATGPTPSDLGPASVPSVATSPSFASASAATVPLISSSGQPSRTRLVVGVLGAVIAVGGGAAFLAMRSAASSNDVVGSGGVDAAMVPATASTGAADPGTLVIDAAAPATAATTSAAASTAVTSRPNGRPTGRPSTPSHPRPPADSTPTPATAPTPTAVIDPAGTRK